MWIRYRKNGGFFRNDGRVLHDQAITGVEPSDPDGSFLLDVLTAEGAVAYPHTGLVTRSEDINLLRVWIEKGCPQN